MQDDSLTLGGGGGFEVHRLVKCCILEADSKMEAGLASEMCFIKN
jgi:hypothetical protein